MHLTWVFLGVLAWLENGVNAGKILILHPMSASSHTLALRALAHNLVKNGHEVSDSVEIYLLT